jgi:hypothetical protein
MDARLAKRQQGFAVQRERPDDGVGAIRGVDDVVDDFQTMRVLDGAAAPGAQIFPFAVEYHHRGVLALEYVNPVL